MSCLPGIPIVGKALDEISQAVVGSVKREFGYLYNYKDNVKKLEVKIEELHVVEQRLASKVENDKDAGKKMESDVESEVKNWQAEVKQVKGEAQEILRCYNERKSWRCLRALRVPNLYSRFRLGREALKSTDKETGLIDRGKVFVDGEIAFLPRFEYHNDPNSDSDYVDFKSRKKAFNKIWEALNRQNGSPVIGILGMPGVGKTKLMEQVSKQAKEEKTFNEIARANVSAKVDIHNIQGQLARWLRLELPQEAIEEERAFRLSTRLKNEKKILVILDDVWNEIPLGKIGIPYGDGSIKGCKILLTSRKEDVCRRNNCKDQSLFEIKSLEPDEAWHLFKKNVGSSTLETLNNESLAKNVCAECACLPLVISAVGRALKSKPKLSWEAALGQLKNCSLEEIEGIDPKVYAGLELSFHQLQNKDAKTCLLLCSLYDEDAEIKIEQFFKLAKGTGLLKDFDTFEEERIYVGSVIVELKSSSLLLEGQGDTVKLHDTIRDVARSIAFKEDSYAFLSKSCGSRWPRQDNYSPRKLIDLSFKSDNVEFPDGLVCEQLHTLRLRFQISLLDLPDTLRLRFQNSLLDLPDTLRLRFQNSLLDLPDSFFNGFKNLRLLSLSLSPLPSSLGNLINLRMLDLHNCEIKEISLIILLKNLEMLCLHNCRLPEPLDLGGLKRLRMLDLADCDSVLMLRHALSSLRNLEELLLPGVLRILPDTEANEEVPILPKLSKLTLLTNLQIRLKDSMFCPDRNFCKKLARFKISVGCTIPSSLAMRSLAIMFTSIKGGVKSLVERAEEVKLFGVTHFENCFSNNSGEAFVNLTSLNIMFSHDAERLAKFPQNDILDGYQSRPFSKLCELDIQYSGFKYLFCASSARCLVQLQTLVIRGCGMMEEIARNENSIEEDDEIIEFPRLRSIDLDELPSSRSFYSRSRNMSITEENTAHESLFDGMVAFPSLRILRIRKVHINVQYLFNRKVVFPTLEELVIDTIDNVREIWENQCHLQDSFSQLKMLNVRSCPQLQNVIPFHILQNLHNLEELDIMNCDSLISDVGGPNNGGEITAVAPASILPQLTKMSLEGLPTLTETGFNSMKFSSETTLYPNLKRLHIDRCYGLRNVFLPSVVRHLVYLKKLRLSNCENMKEIIAAIGKGQDKINDNMVLPKLEKLLLFNLPTLDSFWCHGSMEYPNINQPQSYLGQKVAFPSLDEFVFNGCSTINLAHISLARDHKLDDFTSQLRILEVKCRTEVPLVIPHHWLLGFRNLEKLKVKNFSWHGRLV